MKREKKGVVRARAEARKKKRKKMTKKRKPRHHRYLIESGAY